MKNLKFYYFIFISFMSFMVEKSAAKIIPFQFPLYRLRPTAAVYHETHHPAMNQSEIELDNFTHS